MSGYTTTISSLLDFKSWNKAAFDVGTIIDAFPNLANQIKVTKSMMFLVEQANKNTKKFVIQH